MTLYTFELEAHDWFCLLFHTGQEWMSLVPFVGTVSIIVYVTVLAFRPPPKPKDVAVNLKIQKESPKVVNMVDIEDLGDKISYCRCWRSKKVRIALFHRWCLLYRMPSFHRWCLLCRIPSFHRWCLPYRMPSVHRWCLLCRNLGCPQFTGGA